MTTPTCVPTRGYKSPNEFEAQHAMEAKLAV
jgi:hypothetical protein